MPLKRSRRINDDHHSDIANKHGQLHNGRMALKRVRRCVSRTGRLPRGGGFQDKAAQHDTGMASVTVAGRHVSPTSEGDSDTQTRRQRQVTGYLDRNVAKNVDGASRGEMAGRPRNVL